MSVTVRPLGDKDFFPWLGLFEGYSAFYESELTDQKALQVWSWIIDPNNSLDGAVAVDDRGDFVGLAHYRTVPRTLSGDLALFLDDLYVAEDARGKGVGTLLMDFTKAYARERKLAQVQLVTAADNATAQVLYDQVGTRTDWVTYEIDV
ncbi:GNAT family N-acetyltransferase [Cryobacterium sp. TMT1-3]|uniref:GNAT family N-acetyltransferase n=1 Tax=Cryobacterium luteum TaxID=1424661 RepID=A0A1H8IEN7_9MICO|nr:MULTISPECIES: GNAT family N-acetyltransferase [Cryobacterium]TFB95544.1 GNAT family N-acetyltransferase [Cryobacterium luteum]TFC31307.1 GNAT family N-acetyltransferase [Cryobacterium sp. TMT1-3]SEN66178.1 Ribosomal protein S18 acetylase RimI [Cryobacterium luteum]